MVRTCHMTTFIQPQKLCWLYIIFDEFRLCRKLKNSIHGHCDIHELSSVDVTDAHSSMSPLCTYSIILITLVWIVQERALFFFLIFLFLSVSSICSHLKGCEDGFYSQNCNRQCSGHCKDNATCNHVTGQCEEGCAAGWKGLNCDIGRVVFVLNVSLDGQDLHVTQVYIKTYKTIILLSSAINWLIKRVHIECMRNIPFKNISIIWWRGFYRPKVVKSVAFAVVYDLKGFFVVSFKVNTENG